MQSEKRKRETRVEKLTMVALYEEEQQHNVMNMLTKSETRLKDMRNLKIHATVVAAPRKSVKRMMFETMVDCLARLFSATKGKYPSNKVHGCSKMDKAMWRRKIKRVYAQTDLNLIGEVKSL